MLRWLGVKTAAVLLLVGAGLGPRGLVAAPMNVVLLYADDWRHDTLGCAGHTVVKTPRLDELAAEGVRFSNAYVTTSICGVSRATLLTGQWMSRHGNTAFEMFKTPWSETFPARLRAAGYAVAHVGKWHNGRFPSDHYDFGRAYSGKHWLTRPGTEPVHVTQQNERDALEFLKDRPRDRPFCLTVAFFAPHAEDGAPDQYLPQPETASLYEGVEIPVPVTAGDAYFRRLPGAISRDGNEGRARWRKRFATAEGYQQFMKRYYRLVSEVDAACGRVLDQLRADGLLEQTLVVFTTDNGYLHGEHGLADKWYPYEESIRVPLIVRDPRCVERGVVREAMVLNADLAPTLLGAAAVAAPAGMQGRDLAPVIAGRTPNDWRTEFFYEHGVIKDSDFIPASEALVRRDVKYTRWPATGDEEVYDLVADRSESQNVAALPEWQERKARLLKAIERLKEQAQ